MALDVSFGTGFQAVACMRRNVEMEMFVITAKAESSLGAPCSAGLFKVARGGAGVVLGMIWVCV